jgi:hypothetical protein
MHRRPNAGVFMRRATKADLRHAARVDISEYGAADRLAETCVATESLSPVMRLETRTLYSFPHRAA